MPQKSRWTVPIPGVSLPTFLFGPPGSPLPDGLAYADPDSPSVLSMTWYDLRLWCQRLAAGLLAAGLQEDDRVVIFAGNNIFYPVLHTGVMMAGGIYSTANPHYVPRELAYQLGITKPRFVIASRATLAVALEAAAMAELPRDSVFVLDDAPLEKEGGGEDVVVGGAVTRHWKALLANKEVGENFVWRELTLEESKAKTAALMFSSGTTGLPKGIGLSHHSLIADAIQVSHVLSLDPKLRTAEQSAKHSRWLCVIPLYHGLGLILFVHLSTVRRLPTYIMKQYEINRMMSHIQTFRITELQVVPPIIIAVTKHPKVRDGTYDISSLNRTLSCAAPLGAEVTVQYESLWPAGHMNVQQGLAMSETGGMTLYWDPTLKAPPGSVGEPMPNVEVMLADDDGKEVAKGERGEIWIRAPNCMKGYWNNPKATAETITPDGWLMTGDIGCQDEQGWYYVVDRKKELIKVKGIQVAPAELEAILLDHPNVQDAAVIGVTTKWGEEEEVPLAYIVSKPGVTLKEQDIKQWMDGKVSSVKKLAGGVIFTDAIPKAPSGKILRRLLREDFKSRAKASRL
ncbi:acetyl-CoA synthetase-like protein [Thozetella sp. PMI_491]|nr:acetyl-CoA synthetase-like protein [Thozetella sp. PMI_491]